MMESSISWMTRFVPPVEGKRRGDGHHAGYHTADDGETDDGCEVHYAIHKSFLVQLREVFIT